MQALVRAAAPRPPLEDGWDAAAWARAETLELAHFRAEGSDHRPRTRCRLLHDGAGLAGIFRVEDRYVRSVHERFGDPVYEDSCVEVFLQPLPDRGYLNLEMNCGGTLRASYVTDHRRVPGGFAAFTPLTRGRGPQRRDPLVAAAPRRPRSRVAARVAARLLRPPGAPGAPRGRARPARRAELAREPLQVRRPDLASALGFVGAARRAQLPPAPAASARCASKASDPRAPRRLGRIS